MVAAVAATVAIAHIRDAGTASCVASAVAVAVTVTSRTRRP